MGAFLGAIIIAVTLCIYLHDTLERIAVALEKLAEKDSAPEITPKA